MIYPCKHQFIGTNNAKINVIIHFVLFARNRGWCNCNFLIVQVCNYNTNFLSTVIIADCWQSGSLQKTTLLVVRLFTKEYTVGSQVVYERLQSIPTDYNLYGLFTQLAIFSCLVCLVVLTWSVNQWPLRTFCETQIADSLIRCEIPQQKVSVKRHIQRQ